MSSLFHMLEAASIGIHACILMAKNPETPLSAREISEIFEVSFDHTVRVLHRLRQGGILKSIRGPSGGFLLTESPQKITILKIYEVLEGKLEKRHCLFMNAKCKGKCPLFGELTHAIDEMSGEFFRKTTLSDLAQK